MFKFWFFEDVAKIIIISKSTMVLNVDLILLFIPKKTHFIHCLDSTDEGRTFSNLIAERFLRSCKFVNN